jgi:ferric-dicitrate binding protein FerR (iron transport regulator)
MPATTFTPIDNAVVEGLRLGDEAAFEKLFREHYTALINEALAAFDDPAAASRVVETSFVRAWRRRAELATPGDVENFLRTSVHDGAVRERSRIAAIHRFESHEGARKSAPNAAKMVPVDTAWAHVSAAVHAPAPDAKASAKQMADHARHAAAEHVAHVSQPRSLVTTIAGVVAIIALAAVLMFVVFRDTPEKRTQRALAATDARIVPTREGQIGDITLDDGTKVKLGPEARLRIPTRFNRDVRAVGIEGTASFTVAPGQDLPFEVHARKTALIATGTSFSVSADSADNMVIAKVSEGTVEMRLGDVVKQIGPGQAMMVDATNTMRTPTPQELDESLGWMDGRFIVIDRTLRTGLAEMKRWYGLILIPESMRLLERKVSVNASLDSSKQAIAGLESSGKLKFGWQDKNMVLRDAATAKDAPAAKKKR